MRNGTCANFCEKTGRCLVAEISAGQFNDRPESLAKYIRGPKTRLEDIESFVDEYTGVFSPSVDPPTVYPDEFMETLHASLAQNEEGYESTYFAMDDETVVVHDQFIWRKRHECTRGLGKYSIATEILENANGYVDLVTTATCVSGPGLL